METTAETEEQTEKLRKKLNSRRWRMNNLYWVEDVNGNKVKFHLNWAQELFMRTMWWLNVILKARQLGFSTFMAIYMLDTCLFKSTQTCGIVDKTDKDATKKLAKIKFAYDNMDCRDPCDGVCTASLGAEIKAKKPLLKSNDHELEWGGTNSKVWAGSSLRGGTLQILHISELGYIAAYQKGKAKEIRSGALNTVHKGCVIVIESTHEGGKTGLNYDMVKLAQETGEPENELQWKFHFFAWWQHPDYTLTSRVKVKLPPDLVKYFKELSSKHGVKVTEGQKIWYYEKRKTQKEDMQKEYPSTPEEAVNAVIKGAIYGKLISQARAQGRVCDFNPTEGLPFYTSWDLGVSDFASIWLFQVVGRQICFYDWYENNGEGAGHYAEVVRQWEADLGIRIVNHYLPHDAAHREKGSGISYVETLSECAINNVVVVPRTSDIWIGINKCRALLPNCVFHKSNTSDKHREKDGDTYPSGVGALETYRTQDESSSAVIKEMPIHDKASHTSDAFRTFGEAWSQGLINAEASGKAMKSGVKKVTVKMGTGGSSKRVKKVRVKR